MKYEEYITKKEYKLFNPKIIHSATLGHMAFATREPRTILGKFNIVSHSDDFTKIYFTKIKTNDFCSLNVSECSPNYELVVKQYYPRNNKNKLTIYKYNEYISTQYVYEFSDNIKKWDYLRFKRGDEAFDAIVLCNKGGELYITIDKKKQESALMSMVNCEFTVRYPYDLWILTPKIMHNDVEIIINPGDKIYKLDSHFGDVLSFEQMLCKLYQGYRVRPITCPEYIYYIYDSVNKCVRNQEGYIINIWADDFNDCWELHE